MLNSRLSLLRTVVDLPTAPFVEQHVVRFITECVSRRSALSLRSDRFGNLLIRYSPGRSAKRIRRPILFAAHMDHPGFIATEMIDARHVRADWRGWVEAPFFRNARIRFFSEGRWIPGVVTRVSLPKAAKTGTGRKAAGARAPSPESVVVRVGAPIAPGSPGMWALGDSVIRGGRIHARACDDLAGLAAILCMLDEMCRKNSPVPTMAFFTRAEEVGFAGALAAVADKTVPREAIVVAVENSKAITGVEVGGGPVLRVGDKASVFTPAATGYCHAVADQLLAKDKSFQYQRKLMDGGTCESTAYCHFGYDATGICLPLVNYHNMDMEKRRIAPESVSTSDFLNLVKWFVALAESPATVKFDGAQPGLDQRLRGLLKQHRSRLLRTAAVLGSAEFRRP